MKLQIAQQHELTDPIQGYLIDVFDHFVVKLWTRVMPVHENKTINKQKQLISTHTHTPNIYTYPDIASTFQYFTTHNNNMNSTTLVTNL